MSRWSKIIDLVATDPDGTDESGFPSEVESIRSGLFVNKKDVRSSEFHQAAARGVRLEAMFEIRTVEYQGEEVLIFEGQRFEIERTYERGEITELVCYKRGDNHGN